jgi:hypothetical protein
MRRIVVLLLLAAGCPTPSQFREVRPGLSCDRATRVGYRTMTELGYTVTGLVPATVGSNGSIVGTKTKRDGTQTTGRVRIECTADGATLVPIEDSIAPDYEFSRAFGYSFKELVKQPDVEAPKAAVGLEVLVNALTPQESVLDLGGPATVGGAVPVRVTIRNNTDRAVSVDPKRIDLMTAAGDPTSPLGGGALDAALAPGAAGTRVRNEQLSGRKIPPHTTVEAFLVYPPATYTEAQIGIEDVETGETEGFVAAVQ